MRYLALDYGTRRLGLALCDPAETIVSPLACLTVPSAGYHALWPRLKDLVTTHQVGEIVVGLPLNMDGSEGDQARLTRRFAQELQHTLNLPVHLHDERLSSHAADGLLADAAFTPRQRRQRRDMLAACDILNDFLDRRRQNSSPTET